MGNISTNKQKEDNLMDNVHCASTKIQNSQLKQTSNKKKVTF